MSGPDGGPGALPFNAEELIRYSRHFSLPEFGTAGQVRLKQARVLLVGAGGLGSPAALYLAAAGVGTLGLAEFDQVDLSNLQRQVLHGTRDVGRPKLDSAVDRLADINPNVSLEPIAQKLDSTNAMEVVGRYDLVVDGSDNFPTRYLINDACVIAGKPLVYGAILRFDGQASVFFPPEGPCYRCLYPEPPPPDLVPSCAEGGVLGVLPGIVGSIQALETVKLITGIGQTLQGRLVVFDALRLRFRELSISRDPECPVCGDRPSIKRLIDYQQFCGMPAADAGVEISVGDLVAELARPQTPLLLDVRERFEWDTCRLPEAHWIPLGELRSRLAELPSGQRIVAYCHTGRRSLTAVDILRQAGHGSAVSLAGGIDAWSREIDPSVPRY